MKRYCKTRVTAPAFGYLIPLWLPRVDSPPKGSERAIGQDRIPCYSQQLKVLVRVSRSRRYGCKSPLTGQLRSACRSSSSARTWYNVPYHSSSLLGRSSWIEVRSINYVSYKIYMLNFRKCHNQYLNNAKNIWNIKIEQWWIWSSIRVRGWFKNCNVFT